MDVVTLGAAKADAKRKYQSLSTVITDGFPGNSLDPAWSIVRPDATGYRVTGGTLQIDTLPGSIINGGITVKNIITRNLPLDKAWTAEVKITAPVTSDGQGVGLIAYSTTASSSSNDFAMVYRGGRTGGTTRRGLYYQRKGALRNTTRDFTDTATSGLATTWWARLVWDGRTLTGYESQDGTTWTMQGRPVPEPDTVYHQIGLHSANGGGTPVTNTVSFDDFKLTITPINQPIRQPKPWNVNGTTLPEANAQAASVLDILRKNCKYNLNTWWAAKWATQDASQTYLTLKGSGDQALVEYDTRPAASAALGAAALLFTGYWSSSVSTLTETEARRRTIKLISSLAYQHYANNSAGSWGYEWQSALWAAWTAESAWLLWPYLTDSDRENVKRMVIGEADQPYWSTPVFWKNAAGVEQYAGDSKAEEVGWMALIWQIGVAMMPDHPHARSWSHKMIRFMSSAWTTPSDVSNGAVLHGQAVSDFAQGWNVNADGTIINHGIVHPDYMAVGNLFANAAIVFSLAGKASPKALTRNVSLVWGANTQVNFPNAAPYNSPGGTIYKTGVPDLYYPQGNDWSSPGLSTRIADKAATDAMVSAFKLDGTITPNADSWAALHLQKVKDMQARFTTGQVYLSPPDYTEDNYTGREQWITSNVGPAWLAYYVTAYQLYSLSNGNPEAFL